MKIKAVALGSIFALLMAGAAWAGTIPPDGNVGVRGGVGSTEIFTSNFSFNLTDCTPNSGNLNTDDCQQALAAFGSFPQGAFAGDNDSGLPIDQLTLTLNFAALPGPESLVCDGGSFFSVNNCAQQILSTGATSATFKFSKGTGTGIGCFDFLDSRGDNESNADCAATGGWGRLGPRRNLPSPHFVIAVGFGGTSTFFPTLPTTSGGIGATPEPCTMALFFTGLGAMAARKRLRQK
jgi:hypothetical protein